MMAELPSSWRDAVDGAADAPPPPGLDEPAAYAPIAEFQAGTYHRNAFAHFTDDEVRALRDLLRPVRGERVLDVGCADGRHLRRLVEEDGVVGVGVDIVRAPFVADAPPVGLTFIQADGRALPIRSGRFDLGLSLCQGAVGTSPDADRVVLAAMARALRPGGRAVVTFFHALFAARNLVGGDRFDPVHLVHLHEAEVTGPDREVRRFPLWTTTYTVPGAVAALAAVGLDTVTVRGVEPGRYSQPGVALDDPELLILAVKRT